MRASARQLANKRVSAADSLPFSLHPGRRVPGLCFSDWVRIAPAPLSVRLYRWTFTLDCRQFESLAGLELTNAHWARNGATTRFAACSEITVPSSLNAKSPIHPPANSK